MSARIGYYLHPRGRQVGRRLDEIDPGTSEAEGAALDLGPEMGVGLAVGAGIGIVYDNIILGMLAGAALGLWLRARRKRRDKDE